jgi:hypothetical protein
MPRRALSAIAAALGLLSPARAAAAPGDPPPYAAVFDKAFAPGFTVTTRSTYQGETRVETVPFKVVEAGLLTVPSGRVAAADPFIALTDAKPFSQAVPGGTYPVRLAVGDFPSGGVRVAFARVDFSTRPVVRWSMAVVEGQDVATLRDDEIFGYGVDAGTGSFFDPVAGKAAARLLDANPDAWTGRRKASATARTRSGLTRSCSTSSSARPTPSCSTAAGATGSMRRGSATTRTETWRRW